MPQGKAISYHEIRLRWEVPKPINGELRPYEAYCVDSDGHQTTPVWTESKQVTVANLDRNSWYNCTLKASTLHEKRQNASECEASIELPPIKTLDVGEFVIYNIDDFNLN